MLRQQLTSVAQHTAKRCLLTNCQICGDLCVLCMHYAGLLLQDVFSLCVCDVVTIDHGGVVTSGHHIAHT